jgi:hypothetical protein
VSVSFVIRYISIIDMVRIDNFGIVSTCASVGTVRLGYKVDRHGYYCDITSRGRKRVERERES